MTNASTSSALGLGLGVGLGLLAIILVTVIIAIIVIFKKRQRHLNNTIKTIATLHVYGKNDTIDVVKNAVVTSQPFYPETRSDTYERPYSTIDPGRCHDIVAQTRPPMPAPRPTATSLEENTYDPLNSPEPEEDHHLYNNLPTPVSNDATFELHYLQTNPKSILV